MVYGIPGARHLLFRDVVDIFIHFESNTLSALTAIYSSCTINKKIFGYCVLYSQVFREYSKLETFFFTLNCFKIASSSAICMRSAHYAFASLLTRAIFVSFSIFVMLYYRHNHNGNIFYITDLFIE